MTYNLLMGVMAFAGAVYTLAILIGFLVSAKGTEGMLIKASALTMVLMIPAGIAIRRVGNNVAQASLEIVSSITVLVLFHGMTMFLFKVYKSQKVKKDEVVQPVAGGDASR